MQDTATGVHTATTTESSRLLASAATGDQAAWDELVDRYGELVWAVARSHGLDPDEAAEVCQVSWLRLAQRLDAPPGPGGILAWLAATAGRESVRAHRLQGRAVPAAERDATGSGARRPRATSR
jgi:DNA-directed RNA polymerase specialized sigma24 family protein